MRLDSRALQRRLQRLGPKLTSLALAGLIVAECASASISLFVRHPSPAKPAPNAPSLGMRHQQVNIRRILAAHLFGTGGDAGAQDPIPAAANLILTGTIATEDPMSGFAIINDSGAPSEVYRAGQEVSGALVRSVYLDHVLLDRSGSLEILAFPKIAASGAAAMTAQESPSDASEEDEVQVTPVDLGSSRGFRVMGGKEFEPLRASGLRRSDVVTAVNGTPLQDRDSFEQSIHEIQSRAAVLTVMRSGHPTDITINTHE